MSKVKVTVSLSCVLDNEFWGIDEMLEDGQLTIANVRELIEEDMSVILEDGELNITIDASGEKEQADERQGV